MSNCSVCESRPIHIKKRGLCKNCYQRERYVPKENPYARTLEREALIKLVGELFDNGLTMREVADKVGKSLAAVKSILNRSGALGYGAASERRFEKNRKAIEVDVVNGATWTQLALKYGLAYSSKQLLISEHQELLRQSGYRAGAQSRRHFTDEEENQLVELVREQGSCRVARDLGIPRTTLETIMHRKGWRSSQRGRKPVYIYAGDNA